MEQARYHCQFYKENKAIHLIILCQHLSLRPAAVGFVLYMLLLMLIVVRF